MKQPRASGTLLRKKAESDTLESVNSFRLLFEVNPIPLALIDHAGVITMVNKRWELSFGYSLKEIPTINDWWRLAVPDNDYRLRVTAMWEDAINQARVTGTDSVGFHELRITSGNGKELTLEVSGTFVEGGMLFAFYDISGLKSDENEHRRLFELGERDRKALLSVLEDQQEAKKEIQKLNKVLEQRVIERTAMLEASNKDLEAFTYSVSHDLRAPLRHINGFVDLLINQFKNGIPEKAIHYLDTISNSAKQMGSLIDALLLYSRTGRQELKKSELDMNLLVNEVTHQLKTGLEDREIIWDIQKLPIVSGDNVLLKLVWTNLIDNAVKYTRNVKPSEISVGSTEESNDFVFWVKDNGAGFDMKYAHKLFGVFQRLHSQSEFEGTGIGLANVQSIVNKHLGRVWVEAEPGKGAKFYFSLPK